MSAQLAAADAPIQRTVDFLSSEVARWPKENGCFSCHHNGDAARALWIAERAGFHVDPDALSQTKAWLATPEKWSENKGDAGFNDQTLADLQFALTLFASAREPIPSRSFRAAAERVARGQEPAGLWSIDPENPAGSPATLGSALGTAGALLLLERIGGFDQQVRAARSALARLNPSNTATAVAWALALQNAEPPDRSAIEYLAAAQNPDGGWGPFKDSPSESFDTAIAIFALSTKPKEHNAPNVRRAKDFLLGEQLKSGAWPATTRPSGGESHAQQVATTAWVLQALLSIRADPPAEARSDNEN